ncbi:MAG: hypothetical protein ACE5F1_16250 [Planctomycetota bacterium]
MTRPTAAEYRILKERTRYYAQCLSVDDPTVEVDAQTRDSLRRDALKFLDDLETQRVWEVEASRWRGGRDCCGEWVDDDTPMGEPEPRWPVPTTWNEVRAKNHARRKKD